MHHTGDAKRNRPDWLCLKFSYAVPTKPSKVYQTFFTPTQNSQANETTSYWMRLLVLRAPLSTYAKSIVVATSEHSSVILKTFAGFNTNL